MALLGLAAAGPGYGYAPDVPAALAERIASALPPAARWDPAWSRAVGAEVESRIQAEASDPEASACLHRFVAGGPLLDPGLDEASAGAAAVVGLAPRQLVLAAAALREAFAARAGSRVVESLARLAVSASDLADPFLVTAPEAVRVPGAWARFGAAVCDQARGDPGPASWDPSSDATLAGLDLASQSAAARPAIEEALEAGDEARLSGLARERIGAALTLGRAIALAAWQAAGSPALDGAGPGPRQVRVWPSPVFGPATVAFDLPRGGEARIEIFDAAGRRRWSSDLGARRAGLQQFRIEATVLERLPPGLYLARVSSASFEAVGRLVRGGN